MELGNHETLWYSIPEEANYSPELVKDWKHIIASMSSLFFSAYYVNLETDTFRAITQLSRVEDVLGDEVNCTAGFIVYANHFVHPDDRAEYLSVMNIENLRSKLRWWQPSVAVEYRRLEEETGTSASPTWRWVRASAVLARSGPDDMPQKAVYVAQDLTGGRRDDSGLGRV